MVTVGMLVRIEVKPGKSEEFEARLQDSLQQVEQEPGTIAWWAVRLGPTSYAVMDVFPNEEDRRVHLEAGRIRMAKIADLFAEPPSVVSTEVVVAKLPGQKGRA